MRIQNLLLLFLCPGCVLGAFFPPTRTDIGLSVPKSPAPTVTARAAEPTEEIPQNTFHLRTGVHLASISGNPQLPVDLGLGYALEYADTTGAFSQGMYLSLDRFFWSYARPYGSKHISGKLGRRASMGGRAELLFSDGAPGFGLSARLGAEAFSLQDPVAETRHNPNHLSAGFGTFALSAGLFVESSYLWLSSEEELVLFSFGATLRPVGFGMIHIFLPER